MRLIGLPSNSLFGKRIMRVYPPCLSLYFGAMVSTNFLASFAPWTLVTKRRREAMVPILALVTSFSTNGRSSLALAVVVSMRESRMRLRAKERKSACLCVFSRPNFLTLLWCLILLHVIPAKAGIQNFKKYFLRSRIPAFARMTQGLLF